MKHILLVVLQLVILCFQCPALARGIEDSHPEMREPPFWLSSYDEFHQLRAKQKELYLKALKAQKKSPAFAVTDAEIEAAEGYDAAWDALRLKVYSTCADSAQLQLCNDLAQIRIDVLEMGASHR